MMRAVTVAPVADRAPVSEPDAVARPRRQIWLRPPRPSTLVVVKLFAAPGPGPTVDPAVRQSTGGRCRGAKLPLAKVADEYSPEIGDDQVACTLWKRQQHGGSRMRTVEQSSWSSTGQVDGPALCWLQRRK